MASKCPTSLNSFWAVGTSKAASVAPARLSAVPNLKMPEMVKVRVRTDQQDTHVVAHLEVVLLGGAGIHGHVVGAGRGRAGGQVERRQLGVGVEGDADGGRAAGGDGLAVRGDELGEPAERPLGVGHAGHLADGGQRSTRGSACGRRRRRRRCC